MPQYVKMCSYKLGTLSANQEISRILWTLKVYYSCHS